MRRTAVVMVSLLAAAAIAPVGVVSLAHASPRPLPKIHQHVLRRHGHEVVTHSSKATEFDQNLIGSGVSAPVTSSTNVPLNVGVFMDQYSEGRTSETDLEINVSSDSGENHLWDIDSGKRSMIYDPLSGQGTIRVKAAKIAPYGSVSLDITPAGSATTTQCASGGRRVLRPIEIRGTLQFDTQTTTWGSVGDPVDQIVFDKKATAESDYGHVGSSCEGYPTRRCRGDLEVDLAGSAGYLVANTYVHKGHRKAYVFLDHSGAELAGNLSGFADDLAIGNIPVPTLHRGKRTTSVELDAGSSGLVTGTGTWQSSGAATTKHDLCRGGSSSSWAAKFTTGTSPLTVNFAMNGSFVFNDEAKHRAEIEVDSGSI